MEADIQDPKTAEIFDKAERNMGVVVPDYIAEKVEAALAAEGAGVQKIRRFAAELAGDSKQQFSTGAQRDTDDDKPRPDLVSPFMEERMGEWLRKGGEHYGMRNWEKGIPFSRCWASLCRHKMKWQQGKRDEDHLAAIVFNAMAIIHYQEMIGRSVLPDTLNDMPNYNA